MAGSATNSGALVDQYTCSGSAAQSFLLSSVTSTLFTIQPQNSNLCLDTGGTGNYYGGSLTQRTCNGGTSQQWQGVLNADGSYSIASGDGSQCINIAGGSFSPGGSIILWSCAGYTANERFKLLGLLPDGSGGTTSVGITLSPTTVTLSQSQTQSFTPTVTGTSNTSVLWTLSPSVGTVSSSGLYTAPASIATAQTITLTATSAADSTKSASASISLRPPASGTGGSTLLTTMVSQYDSLCLDIAGSATSSGALVDQYSCNGNASQLFLLTSVSSSLFTIQPQNSGLCLDTGGTGNYYGGNVTQRTCSGAASQQWQAVLNSDASYSIASSDGSQCLNIAGGSFLNGGPIIVWSCAGYSLNEHFNLLGAPPNGATTTVSVTVSPTTVTLLQSQTQLFTPTVSGTTNSTVLWTLNPNVGTISSTGLYTAPTSIAATQSVSLTATSTADYTKSASATITLNPPAPVSVSVTPNSTVLTAAQTQAFAATVLNNTNTTVTWSLSPNVGSFNTSATMGIADGYVAFGDSYGQGVGASEGYPAIIQSDLGIGNLTNNSVPGDTATDMSWHIFAVTNPTDTGNALVTGMIGANDAISYDVAAVPVFRKAQYASATWATLSSSNKVLAGASAVAKTGTWSNAWVFYFAPGQQSSTVGNTLSYACQVGTSGVFYVWYGMDGSSDSFTVSIDGALATDTVGGSSTVTTSWLPDKATHQGSSAGAARYVTTPGSHNCAVTVSSGTVTIFGFGFPPSIPYKNLTAPKYFLSGPSKMGNGAYLTQLTAMNAASQAMSQQLVADGLNVSFVDSFDAVDPILDFATTATATCPAATHAPVHPNECGYVHIAQAFESVINGSGQYTAPASISSTQSVILTATSGADPTRSGSATIVLNPPAPAVSLTVAPGSATLTQSQTQVFSATVLNTSNTAVTWSANPAVGSISAAGLYTAPSSISTSQTVMAIATSVADSTKTASASITLSPTSIAALAPVSTTLSPLQTQQFNGSSVGTNVNWSISPNLGTISSSGLYTAPSTIPSPNIITITATSTTDSTKTASASATIVPLVGTSYYLATSAQGGNDANNGLSPTSPWLTPNHSLSCGDVITAAASSAYDPSNFGTSKWGTVNCPGGKNVAWLKCASFDACKISSAVNGPAMWIDNNYWGVQGWEANAGSNNTFGTCFMVAPRYAAPQVVHHVIVANSIANGCQLGGFATNTYGGVGADYVVFVGDIAYNAAAGSNSCNSGFVLYTPSNSDTAAGTHIFLSGNFGWANLNPHYCSGIVATDGEGINLDTLSRYSYTGQTVLEDNLMIFNGGPGISSTTSITTPIIIQHNTTYGDLTDVNQTTSYRGEYEFYGVSQAAATGNIFAASGLTAGGGGIAWGVSLGNGDNTDTVAGNLIYSPAGNNTHSCCGNFTFGTNLTGVSPAFTNPVLPGAPSCGSTSSVNNCMATVISNFTPTATAAQAYGYRKPSSTPTYDQLFPQWLCNVNLPTGLISMGCKTGP